MPHPKGNTKASGDLHLPDVESDLAVEEGHTGLEALAHPRNQSGRAAARRAGVLTDPDLGSAGRLPHVTRGEPIAPGVAPLAAYHPSAARSHAVRPSLPGLALAAIGAWALYRLLRR